MKKGFWLLGGILITLTLLFIYLFFVLNREEPRLSYNLLGLKLLGEEHDIRIGTIDSIEFDPSNPPFFNTITREFNSISPENIFKFENIHPCPPKWLIDANEEILNWVHNHGSDRSGTKYDCDINQIEESEWEWEDFDLLVNWAASYEIGILATPLLWYHQNPVWLNELTIFPNQIERLMEDHISTIIKRYCDFSNVYGYVVVNEGVVSNSQLRPNVWSRIDNYIDKAFRIARETLNKCNRTDVKLYYNDFNIEYGRLMPEMDFEGNNHIYQKTDAVFTYLESLINTDDPTPIDGIGFQTHIFITPFFSLHDSESMVRTMNRFTKELNLEIIISELDITIVDPTISVRKLYEYQARQYFRVMESCIDAINCTGVTIWGIHDGSTWLADPRNPSLDRNNPDPLLFYDANELLFDTTIGLCVTTEDVDINFALYCPKPAYYEIYNALRIHK